jgi:hypothetical protein
MVQAVSGSGGIGVEAMTALRYARMGSQSVVMPVRPAQMITASFKHIQLVPDSRLRDGIPLYKLKILDSLIDQFSRQEAGGIGAAAQPGGLQSAARAQSVSAHGSVDEMITAMSGALKGSGAAAAYRPGLLPVPGAFVDLLA